MSIPDQFRSFVNDEGRIERLPVKWSKKVALADWCIELLELGRNYTEPEVNDIFETYVVDFALIRRMLVDSGKLQRDAYGREYQRVA
ncbi:MAG: DUF2087 domain-containing protein [Microbacteriaceae bacterium]